MVILVITDVAYSWAAYFSGTMFAVGRLMRIIKDYWKRDDQSVEILQHVRLHWI